MATKSLSMIGLIFRRELKSYFESPVAYVFLIVFLLLSGFLTFFVSNFYEAGQADLRAFFFWQPWVYLLLVPAATMRLWSEERRTGTLELLLTLPVTMMQAVIGKFLAAWLFMAIAITLTAPMVVTVLWLGDPDPGAMAGGYIGCLLLAGAWSAVGCVTSAMTRNQVVSFVLALTASLFLLLAGWPPVTNMLSRWAPSAVINAVAALSVAPHVETLQRGILDLRDLLYFFSVMAIMLFAAQSVLSNRKSA